MLVFAAATTPPSVSYWPLAVLAISVTLIVVLITVLRMHAFLALILAAITAGLLSTVGQLPGEIGTIPGNPNAGRSHWVQAIELTATEFGNTAGKIGIIIGLASIIGMCLMESGAADKVVRRFLAVFGEKRAGLALLLSTYVVSIPIFFDTLFMLLVPLAKSMRMRTGHNYILYVMAICGAGVITHSMVAPHPGPLAMAENLSLDVGLTILVGLASGLGPLFGAWLVANWINGRIEVPLRETPGAPLADLESIVARPEHELPGLVESILPVIVPLVLMSLGSVFAALPDIKAAHPALYTVVDFFGNRNLALLVGALLAA
ncbi:MAG: hypothetical protein HYZ36_07820, partial [Pedosphaera parvula]|nr:hypothetical protein [Pedosphaera parvula]